MNSLSPHLAWLVVAVLSAAAGLAFGMRAGRRRERKTETPVTPVPALTAQADERAGLRAAALDSLPDAVLIAERDGRIRDCNSSALTLFGRHRGELEDQYGAGLRRFEGVDQGEPYRAAAEHAVWVGEGWARQPDGGMKLCQVRVMAIRDARARVVAFAESYRDVAQDRDLEQDVRDLVYGVRAFESSGTAEDGTASVREDLRLLSEGFRDLEHVLKQYERLLPALGADDPLAESIAGAAHDVRATVSTVGVPALLQEIPRALARLRGQVQRNPDSPGGGDALVGSTFDRAGGGKSRVP